MSLLFSDIEQLQDKVAISADLPFSDIKPYLLAAQRFVARFTGEALLERLTTKLAASEDLSGTEAALLDRLRVPIANLALLRYANVRNVNVSNVGVQRTHTSNTSDAFEWQIARLAGQLESDAWEGLEDLHRFLEVNSFEEYTESDEFKQDQSLIRSASVFSRYFFINDSRLTFYALQSSLRTAELKRIRPALGTQYATLLAAIQAKNLTEDQELILEHARTALAHATIARALRQRVLDVTGRGVQLNVVHSFTTAQDSQQADKATIDAAIDYHEEEVTSALNSLSKLLKPQPATPTTRSGVYGGGGLVGF